MRGAEVTTEHKLELHFDMLDTDKNGTLSADEFVKGRGMGCPPGEALAVPVARCREMAMTRLWTGTEALFARHNEVIESGKVEGTYADYVPHHIGSGLDHIQRFAFDDYAVTVEQAGDSAWATEIYHYTIGLCPTEPNRSCVRAWPRAHRCARMAS